jgi:hypothetical protein
MAHKVMVFGLTLILAIASASAAPPTPSVTARAQATKYCVRVEPFTGSRVTSTECKTREQWAKEGVNVDDLKKSRN